MHLVTTDNITWFLKKSDAFCITFYGITSLLIFCFDMKFLVNFFFIICVNEGHHMKIKVNFLSFILKYYSFYSLKFLQTTYGLKEIKISCYAFKITPQSWNRDGGGMSGQCRSRRHARAGRDWTRLAPAPHAGERRVWRPAGPEHSPSRQPDRTPSRLSSHARPSSQATAATEPKLHWQPATPRSLRRVGVRGTLRGRGPSSEVCTAFARQDVPGGRRLGTVPVVLARGAVNLSAMICIKWFTLLGRFQEE